MFISGMSLGCANTKMASERTPRKRYRRRDEKLVTVEKSTDICPFCNLPVQKSVNDRRILLVNGKEVIIFGFQLISRCKRAGLPEPDLREKTPFDIRQFLKEQLDIVNRQPMVVSYKKIMMINFLVKRLRLDLQVFKI